MGLNKQKGNMYRLCACGCGTQIPLYGSTGRARSFVIGHSRKGKRFSLAQRFWSKVNKTDANGCWEWLAYKDNKGYGHVKEPGRNGLLQRAHRVAWLLTYGPIPEGVNPKHLFLGSHLDNMQDALFKGRLKSKLDQRSVVEIREKYEDGDLQQELAHEYGISQGQISRIVCHESW